MPFPTVPAFEYVEPAVVVAYIGSTVLGQVKRASGETVANRSENEARRLGDADGTTIYSAATYKSTAELEIYVQDEADELLSLLSDSTPAELDIANTGTLKFAVYDSETAGELEHDRSLANATPVADSFSFDSDTIPTTYTVRFESSSKWITTVAA